MLSSFPAGHEKDLVVNTHTEVTVEHMLRCFFHTGHKPLNFTEQQEKKMEMRLKSEKLTVNT